MGWTLGIDFGTSFTVVASRVDGRSPEIIEVDGERRIPSAIFVTASQRLVIGRAAEELGVADPARLVRIPKVRLGDAAPIVVGTSSYSAATLVAELLATVAAAAVAYHEGPPDATQLTYPATWGTSRQAHLRRAGELAGLINVRLVPEPVAAAVGFAADAQVDVGHHVLVYDLGGGTFDVAALRQTADGPVVAGRPLGTDQVGGELFDELVVNELGSRLPGDSFEQIIVGGEPEWVRTAAALRREARRVKEALSTHESIDAVIPTPDGLVSMPFTRTELASILQPYLADTIDLLVQASDQLGGERADVILLAGGSSRLPIVEEMVRQAFPTVRMSRRGDPKGAVALGATQPSAAIAQPVLERTSNPAAPPADANPTEAIQLTVAAPVATVAAAGSTQAAATGRSATPSTVVDEGTLVQPHHPPRRRHRAMMTGLGVLAAAGLTVGAIALAQGDDAAGPDTTTSTSTSPTSDPTTTSITTTTSSTTTTTIVPTPAEDVVAALTAAGGFDTLTELFSTTDVLAETLVEGATYTLFAPTDEAFEALSPGVLEDWVADEELLSKILRYHLVDQAYSLDELTSAEYETAVDDLLAVDISGADVNVGVAMVTEADIDGAFGVIHAIDAVLIPPSIFAVPIDPLATTTTVLNSTGGGGTGGGGGGGGTTATTAPPVNNTFRITSVSPLSVSTPDAAGTLSLTMTVSWVNAPSGGEYICLQRSELNVPKNPEGFPSGFIGFNSGCSSVGGTNGSGTITMQYGGDFPGTSTFRLFDTQGAQGQFTFTLTVT